MNMLTFDNFIKLRSIEMTLFVISIVFSCNTKPNKDNFNLPPNNEKMNINRFNKSYDTTTECGKMEKKYHDLITRYNSLRTKHSEDSIVYEQSKLFFERIKTPELFDGDTVPCRRPLGNLGHSIGTALNIKGKIDNNFRGKTSTSNYYVYEVNGIKLPEPISIRFNSNPFSNTIRKYKEGTKIDLFGYETGGYAGNPPGINAGSQLKWTFLREFIVVKILTIDSTSQ